MITGPVAMIEVDWYYVFALEVEDPVLKIVAVLARNEVQPISRGTLDLHGGLEPGNELGLLINTYMVVIVFNI